MSDAPVYHDGSSETTPTSRLEWPVNTFNVQIFQKILTTIDVWANFFRILKSHETFESISEQNSLFFNKD